MDAHNNKLQEILTHIEVSPLISEYAESVRENILVQVNARIDASHRQTVWLKVSAIAASVLIVLGISNYFSYNEGYKKQNRQLVTLENPLGIRSSVTLPDGSKVTLNAGTTLTYPTVFVSSQREVKIQGEAYFDIAHDASHPFIVEAENIRIKVLGTQFNVKVYEEEKNIEVTLCKGRVEVGTDAGSKPLNMEPGQLIRFDKTKNTFSRRQVAPHYYTAWKEGKFYFNSVTFQHIAKQLERNFNVEITITSDKLRDIVFTGDFVRGENLEQMLRVMTLDKRIKYKIEGDQVYISEK